MKKQIISHLVALILGLIGGFTGHDLSVFQKPAEQVVEKAVDAVVPPAPAPASAPAPAPAPAPVPADAGAPAPAPAQADAGA